MGVRSGDIVNLSVLDTNTTLVAFKCTNRQILIIGSRRMIMTQAIEPDSELAKEAKLPAAASGAGMARVAWSQNLHDVESCQVSFDGAPNEEPQSSLHARLDLNIRKSGGKSFEALSIVLRDASLCSQVLKAIQMKKLGKKYEPPAVIPRAEAGASVPPGTPKGRSGA